MILIGLGIAPAHGASPIEEIVVTATLRDAVPLERVPASIAVLDADTIETSAVQHFEELALRVPNLNYSGEGSRARYFQVRGVGELEQYEGAPNPSVGFIVDDIDFSALGGIATTFDVARIEVLRGPQGTRYGANALGGLIYVQTMAPPESADARVETLAGSDGALGMGLAAGGPVAGADGRLGWRLAIQHYGSDGFRRDAFLGRDDTNDRDELTARGKLRWRPADGWQADLTGMLVDIDDGYDAWTLDGGFTTQSDRPGRDTQRTSAGSLRVTGALGEAATLVSITGVADSDVLFSFDSDWGNDVLWAPDIYRFTQRTERERRTLNQELRLASGPAARLPGNGDWLIGLYALDVSESNRVLDGGLLDLDDGYCASPGVPAGSCDPFAVDRELTSDYDATSLALFAEAGWPLGERTRLSLGLRGERRETDYADTLVDRAYDATASSGFSPTDRSWGGELALTRELAPGTTGFARIARGYRAGGFNPTLARFAPADARREFGDEALWSYEAGLRFAAAELPLSASLMAFREEREDMQVKVPIQYQPGDPNTFVFITDNAGSAHDQGLEAEIAWSPDPRVVLQATAGWLDTRIDRFPAQAWLEGHEFPHAPHLSWALAAAWQGEVGWFARADLAGRSAFWFDYDTSTGDDRKSDPSTVLDLRAGRQWPHWRVEAWVRNVLDEDYAVRGFYFGNQPPAFAPTRYVRPGDPRQAGVTVSWRM